MQGKTTQIKKDWYQYTISTPNKNGGYRVESGFGTTPLKAMYKAFQAFQA